MSDAERTVLLVAGAAAGMSATFIAPLSAILAGSGVAVVRVEAAESGSGCGCECDGGGASAVVAGVVADLSDAADDATMHPRGRMPLALLLGLLAGLLAMVLSKCVHFFEEMFEKLPIHWMWWPAIGGVVIGLGGLVFPPALGRWVYGDSAVDARASLHGS